MTFLRHHRQRRELNAWLTNIHGRNQPRHGQRRDRTLSAACDGGDTIHLRVLIEHVGYTLFFISMGLTVVVCGLVGGLIMKEAPVPKETLRRRVLEASVLRLFGAQLPAKTRCCSRSTSACSWFAIAEQISGRTRSSIHQDAGLQL
jgi:hypothetical protein